MLKNAGNGFVDAANDILGACDGVIEQPADVASFSGTENALSLTR